MVRTYFVLKIVLTFVVDRDFCSMAIRVVDLSNLVTLYFLTISADYENNEKCADFDLIGRNTYIDYENDNQTEETFRIECEEKDVFFGSFVTIFIFVPGLALSVILGWLIYEFSNY